MKSEFVRHALKLVLAIGVLSLMSGCATPLQKATIKGDTARIDLLLSRGHNIDADNGYDLAPAGIAVVNNDEPTLRHLFDNGASMLLKLADQSFTLLHVAAGWYKGGGETGSASAEIVELLISRGCDVNAFARIAVFTMINRVTPLHLAASMGDPEIAGLLLERGADPHLRNSKGKLPLDWAKDRHASDPRRGQIIDILEKAMAQRPAAVPGAGTVVAPPPIVVPEMNVLE